MKSILFSCASITAMLLTSGAYAQAGSAPSDAASDGEYNAGTGDDILVTARRRAERIQDVPLAVSAVTSQTLEQNNITSAVQLSRAVPSLVSSNSGGGGRALPIFSIRGLSQQDSSILSDPSVSIYIDDVVAARTQGVNSTFYDIGSVEVVKGPQGTLFGRNVTGGAILIRTNKPTNELEGMLAVTYGSFDMINTEGMINLPVADDILAFRLAFATQNDDGYVYDELLGRNINHTNNESIRFSMLARPFGDAETVTTYTYFNENDGGTPSFLKFINPAGSLNSPAARAARNYRPLEELLAEQRARGIWRVANGTPVFTKVRTHQLSNDTTIPVTDSLTVRNIFGYRRINSMFYSDQDGTMNSLMPNQRIDAQSQISNEFQLLGETSKLNWIIGAYYFREKGTTQGLASVGATDPGLIERDSVFGYPATLTNTYSGARNKSYAAFAQGTYQLDALAEGLSVTAGIRFTQDKRRAIILNRTPTACRYTRDLDGNPATPEVAVPLSQCNLTLDAKFSEPTYNVSLEYKLDRDKLIYLAHRHGYRAGGFGARATTEAGLRRILRPETVDDIELGFKSDWRFGDAFLRTNIAAYYSRYNDIQRLLIDPLTPGGPTTVSTNAGKARIYGLEADILFRPVPALELTANYAYTNAKFTDFIAPDGTDLTNAPFARAPKNVVSLGARYTFDVGSDSEISFGGNFIHTDSYSGSDSFAPSVIVSSYQLVNVDARWSNILDTGLDLSVFATNLLKERYSFYLINLDPQGFASQVPGAPRQLGVRASYRF